MDQSIGAVNAMFHNFFRSLGNLLFAPASHRQLLIGASLFLAIKLLFVSFGAFSMHGPRIGDDSYVYLWFTEQTGFSELMESPGVRSITDFSEKIDVESLDEEGRFSYYRVVMRLVGHPKNNFLHGIFAPTLGTDLSFYQLFWIQEIVISIILSLGLYLLFRAAPLLPAIGFVLPLVAMSIFPGQGMHFLIPSTLSLGFGFMIWAFVLSGKKKPVLLFNIGLLCMLSHTVGIAHAGIGGLIAIVLYAIDRTSFSTGLVNGAALLVALIAYLALVWTGLLETGERLGYTDIGLQYIWGNVTGLGQYMHQFVEDGPAAIIFILFGFFAFVTNARTHIKLATLVCVITATALVSGIYFIQEYDGSVIIRLIVPVMILIFCFAYVRNDVTLREKLTTKQKHQAGFFYCILALASFLSMIDYSLGNRENRWEQVERAELKRSFKELGAGEHVVYLEEDIALQAAFLVGGEKHVSSAASLLRLDREQSEVWLEETPPTVFVTPVPRELMPYRKYDWSLFSHRDYGFPMNSSAKLELTLPQSISQLTVRTATGAGNLIYEVNGNPCEATSHSSDLFADLDLATCAAGTEGDRPLTITGDGFISGFSTGNQKQDVNWPWGENISYRFEYGSWLGFSYKTIESGFDLSQLDETFDLPVFRKYLGRLQPIEDRSGIVFFRLPQG